MTHEKMKEVSAQFGNPCKSYGQNSEDMNPNVIVSSGHREVVTQRVKDFIAGRSDPDDHYCNVRPKPGRKRFCCCKSGTVSRIGNANEATVPSATQESDAMGAPRQVAVGPDGIPLASGQIHDNSEWPNKKNDNLNLELSIGTAVQPQPEAPPSKCCNLL